MYELENNEEASKFNTRDLLNLVLDKINTGIIVIDNNGRIIYVNNMCEEFLNVSFSKIKNLHYSEAFPHIPENERFTLKTLETGKEFKNIGYDKARFNNRYAITDTALLNDNEDNLRGAVGIFRDITPVQELQVKIKEREKLSALAEVAKGMAHEIRNPLTGINIFLQMINQKALNQHLSPEFVTQNYNAVNKEVEKIKQILDDFLKLAEPGPTNDGPHDLNHLLNSALNSLQQEMEKKQINLTLNLKEGIKVQGEKESLEQMIIYLIDNAIDMVQEGGKIHIKTSIKKDRAIFEIEDNGSEIPEELKDKIFTPFFTTKDYGTGLGLSLVQKIVNEHGGEVKVGSKYGQGTVFKIYLPNSPDNQS